jgi:hypothetical protein
MLEECHSVKVIIRHHQTMRFRSKIINLGYVRETKDFSKSHFGYTTKNKRGRDIDTYIYINICIAGH